MESSIFRDVFTTKIYIKNIDSIYDGYNLRHVLIKSLSEAFHPSKNDNVLYTYFEPFGNETTGTGTVNAPTGPPFNLSEIQRMAVDSTQVCLWIFDVDSGLERDANGFIIDPERHFHLSPFKGPSLDFDIFANNTDQFIKHLKSVTRHGELSFILDTGDHKPYPTTRLISDVAIPCLFGISCADGLFNVNFYSIMEAIQAICVLHGNTNRPHKTIRFCNDDGSYTPWPLPNIIGKGLARDGSIIQLEDDNAFFELNNLRKDLFDTRLNRTKPHVCEICNKEFNIVDIHANKKMVVAVCKCEADGKPGYQKITYLGLKIENGKHSYYQCIQPIECIYENVGDFQCDTLDAIRLECFTAKSLFEGGKCPVIHGMIVNCVGRIFIAQVHVSDLYAKNPGNFLQSFGGLWTMSVSNMQQCTVKYIDIRLAPAENVIDPASLDIEDDTSSCSNYDKRGEKCNGNIIIHPNQYLHMIFERPSELSEDSHINKRCTLTALWTDENYHRLTKTIGYFSKPEVVSGCSHMNMLVMGIEEEDLRRNIRDSFNLKTYWKRIDLLSPSAERVHNAFGKTQLAAMELSLRKRVFLFEEEELGDGLMMANMITLLLAICAKEKVVMVFPDVVYLEKALQYLHQLCGDQHADNLGITKYLEDFNPFMHHLSRGLVEYDIQRYELGRRVSDVTQRARWVKILGDQIDIFDRMIENGSADYLTPKEYYIIKSATDKLSTRFLKHHSKIILTTPMFLSKIIFDHDKTFLNSGVNIVAYDVTRTPMTNSLAMMMGNPKRIIMFGSRHKDRQCVQDYGAKCAGLNKSLYDFFNIRGLPFELNCIRNYPQENGLVI